MRQRGEGGWVRIGELLPAYFEQLEQRWKEWEEEQKVQVNCPLDSCKK